MQLTIVVQNLGHGGLKNGDGEPEDRWPLLAERINSAADRVDVVMLCEAVDWHSYGHKQLARAMRDLDLDAVPWPPDRPDHCPSPHHHEAPVRRHRAARPVSRHARISPN